MGVPGWLNRLPLKLRISAQAALERIERWDGGFGAPGRSGRCKLGAGDKAGVGIVPLASAGDKAADQSAAANGSPVRTPQERPDARTAALQLQIHDLESKVAALSEAIASEKARSLAFEAAASTAAARLAALETDLQAVSEARDAAGAVAHAAVTELREVKGLYDTIRRERDDARSEREALRAAASAAEARVDELELLLKAETAARVGDAEAVRVLERRLREQELRFQQLREELQRAEGQITLLKGLVDKETGR